MYTDGRRLISPYGDAVTGKWEGEDREATSGKRGIAASSDIGDPVGGETAEIVKSSIESSSAEAEFVNIGPIRLSCSRCLLKVATSWSFEKLSGLLQLWLGLALKYTRNFQDCLEQGQRLHYGGETEMRPPL